MHDYIGQLRLPCCVTCLFNLVLVSDVFVLLKLIPDFVSRA